MRTAAGVGQRHNTIVVRGRSQICGKVDRGYIYISLPRSLLLLCSTKCTCYCLLLGPTRACGWPRRHHQRPCRRLFGTRKRPTDGRHGGLSTLHIRSMCDGSSCCRQQVSSLWRCGGLAYSAQKGRREMHEHTINCAACSASTQISRNHISLLYFFCSIYFLSFFSFSRTGAHVCITPQHR